MKNILSILVILMTSSILAQQPIKKSIGEFTSLKVYDLINVELIKSDENRVEITGDNASDVVIVNKNGTLKIRMSLEEIFDGNKTDIKLYYTEFDILDANEGALITSSETIDQYEIDLRAQEGGIIKLDLKATEALIKADTGGIIEPTGRINNQNIKISTGGIYNGKELESITAKVSIKAGGVVEVNASELIDIKIAAGGDVFIYGNPNTVNEKRALGGRIKRMQ